MTESDLIREAAMGSLTSKGADLLKEVEDFSGLRVSFEKHQLPPNEHSSNPFAPATALDHTGATIYVHGTDDKHLFGVPHELLHIRRHWNESVPQLHPKDGDPAKTQIIGGPMNVVEHLTIVPLEHEFGSDNSGYWKSVALHKWETFPWAHLSLAPEKRNNALLGALENLIAPDQEVLDKAASVYTALGIADEAKKFTTKMQSLLTSPPRAFACLARFMKWQTHDLKLVYFDPRSKSYRSEALPKS